MADNFNISPDMIDSLVNMLKNDNSNDNSFPKKSSKEISDDISFSKFKNEDEKNHENKTNSSTGFNNLDFATIIKIKSIIENLNNSNNQDSQLLYSLKPYLRKSRQKKIDQYINILKISQVSKLFNQKGDVD